MDFTLEGRQFAEVTITRMGGQRGVGSYRLLINVKLNCQPREKGDEATLLEIGGNLTIEGAGTGPVGRLEQMDGPTPIKVLNNAWSWTQVLLIDLDYRQLEKIEEIRHGGGLRFTFALWGLAQCRGEIHRLTGQESYSVNQGTWVEILQELGYTRTLLLEIPVPDEQVSPELAQAVKHIARAQQALIQGKSRDAAGCCREALESISVALGDNDSQDAGVQELFKNSKSLDKAARFRVLRRALKLCCHPAHHADEVSDQIEYYRADAVSLITMIAALSKQIGAERT